MRVDLKNKAASFTSKNTAKINPKNISFKGEFEDVLELSKKTDSPNEIQKSSRMFLGPKRVIIPTKEKLQVLEEAINSPEVKPVWKSFFNMIRTAWQQTLK